MGCNFFWRDNSNWKKVEIENPTNFTILKTNVIYSLMHEMNMFENINIAAVAKFFGVPRSSYYYWLKSNNGKRKKENDLIVSVIKVIRNTRFIKAYGIRRITEYINSNVPEVDFKVNHKRIARLCLLYDLNSKFRRKRRHYKKVPLDVQYRENLINRDFDCYRPLQKVFTDISQINTNKGTLFISSFIDPYNNKLLGTVISTNQKEELVLEGLRNILAKYDIQPYSLTIHTDRGCQYTGKKFRDTLAKAGIIHSMSRAGHCPDNAPIERFWGIFKDEVLRIEKLEFNSLDEAKQYILDYIEFYNNSRLRKS